MFLQAPTTVYVTSTLFLVDRQETVQIALSNNHTGNISLQCMQTNLYKHAAYHYCAVPIHKLITYIYNEFLHIYFETELPIFLRKWTKNSLFLEHLNLFVCTRCVFHVKYVQLWVTMSFADTLYAVCHSCFNRINCSNLQYMTQMCTFTSVPAIRLVMAAHSPTVVSVKSTCIQWVKSSWGFDSMARGDDVWGLDYISFLFVPEASDLTNKELWACAWLRMSWLWL